MTNKEKVEETKVLEIKDVNKDDVFKSMAFQSILKEGEEKGYNTDNIKEFFSNGLQKMFDNQNKTVDQFVKILEYVIDIEKSKEETKNIIDTYEKISKDPVVKEALRELDNEMNEITPMIRKMQNLLEDSTGFFGQAWENIKNFFSKDDGTILSNTLKGLKGRINSIGTAFDNYEVKLQTNQEIASKHIPELSKRIFQINGMNTILINIKDHHVSNSGTKDFLDAIINQLSIINGINYESLQRLIVASRMNGNAQLLLKATEFKVFGLMPSLISLSYILNTQSEVNELSVKADEFINILQENSKDKIEKNMKNQLEAKQKTIKELKKVTDNIEWLNNEISIYNENMNEVQIEINNYLPIYKEKIEQLQNGIMEMMIPNNDVINIINELRIEMDEQKEELSKNLIEPVENNVIS